MDETIDTDGDFVDTQGDWPVYDNTPTDLTVVDPSKTYYDQAEGVTYYKNAAGQLISTRTDTGAVSTVDPATGEAISSSGGIASGTDNSGIFSGLKDTLSKAGVSQSVLDKVFSGAGLAALLGGVAGVVVALAAGYALISPRLLSQEQVEALAVAASGKAAGELNTALSAVQKKAGEDAARQTAAIEIGRAHV